MPPITVTSAVVCKALKQPKGPQGPLNLIGVVHQVTFIANVEPVLRGVLYLDLEGGSGEPVDVRLRWNSENGEHVFLSGEDEPVEIGRYPTTTLPIALAFPCPVLGWYRLEVLVGGVVLSAQSLHISQARH